MKNRVWKTFAAQEVTHSVAHYLTTIHDLHSRHGYARVSDVARELDLNKGSVSMQVKHLKEKGFITEDANRFLQLSPLGSEVAGEVRKSRGILVHFFVDVLGLEPRRAETEACKIEHLLSQETTSQLQKLLHLLESSHPDTVRFLEKLRCMRQTEQAASSGPSGPEKDTNEAALGGRGKSKLKRRG